ncbi:related to endo-1,6-alpha-D-mannanase [Rhynchosporium graminicola]|uniref:Related to endo-1,6-alpha-D-mannanase n=1 Tax=Rhynchosporium graminicola TaxID=2792576 RepID=A0A1E1LNS9_9HELO|nr:related to endo-1,6-alpha-D-mannanase [Rhynchosporium commune]
MLFSSLRSMFLLCSAVQLSNAAANDYRNNAEAALSTLQKWYDTNTGLWNSTGWWNSANCLTTIGDLAAFDPKVRPTAEKVFSNTFEQAQKTNLQQTKVITSNFMMQTFDGPSVPTKLLSVLSTVMGQLSVSAPRNPKGFLNAYYDDEGWWALGWIQAFDVTGNRDYLNAAIDIFTDMKNGTDTICGGGIWWNIARTYKNAITNELYLSVASHLANRVPDKKQEYLDIATKQWDWFQKSGMINSQNLVNDGINDKCTNNNGTIQSYNQGVILGGLVELNKAAPNTTYLAKANDIAKAAIKALSVDGVLHESCEPNCGADGAQFKGIFMRNLQILQSASPDKVYMDFLTTNAAGIWNKDRSEKGDELAADWDGPFMPPVSAATQSSALDALVGAAAFQKEMKEMKNGISS